MARAAGSSTHYEIGVIGSDGRAVGRTIKLPSVTTILGATIPKRLDWYGMKIGVESMLEAFRSEGNVLTFDLDPYYDSDKAVIDTLKPFFIQEIQVDITTKYGPKRVKRLRHKIALEDVKFDDDGQLTPEVVEAWYTALKKRRKITPKTKLAAASERGTLAHDTVEKILKTGLITAGDERKPYINSFLSWYRKREITKANMIAVEQPLFSLQYGYAGTADAIFEHEGKIIVLDLKTARAIYESHLMQPIGYGQAAIEMGFIDHYDVCMVLAVHPDGTYDEGFSEFVIEDFLALKRVYDVLVTRKEKVGA